MKRYLAATALVLIVISGCKKTGTQVFGGVSGQAQAAVPIILPATNNAMWTNGQVLYAGVDELRIRRKPDPALPAINHLFTGDALVYLGRKTEKLYTFELQGRKITAPFVKVEMSNRTVGWAFAGGFVTIRPSSPVTNGRR